MMKAIVQHGYDAPDEVLKLAEVDTPAVGDQELLVRVKASSANPWDWHFIRGEPVLMRPAGHCLIATFRSGPSTASRFQPDRKWGCEFSPGPGIFIGRGIRGTPLSRNVP